MRKLADHLARHIRERRIVIGREHLRRLLNRHGVTFQRTRTWKTSTDPDFEAKLDRIEEVTGRFPNRCFALDQFGPLSIRPVQGTGWAERGKPGRLPATYTRTHGVRYFHGCYALGDDTLWGVTRRGKSGANTLAALKSIRAARPDGAPTYASWANPIEPQFGPLRTFVITGSDHPNHTVLARELQDYLRWRNANARHPDVLAAQRRERARIRGERQQRWGRPRPRAA
nr:IS630 family transposase [Nonomuraea phyllanthi]